MSIDDRGRRAAQSLNSAVTSSVDTEQALAEVQSRPDGHQSARWQRPALAAAAVLLVLVAVSVGFAGQGNDGVDTDASKDKRLEDQLPASAIDGKATMRLPVLVEPQQGIRDGQKVKVAGRGFEPNEAVGVVMCGSEADTGAAGVDACQLGEGFSRLLLSTSADAEGIVSAEVEVSRFIQTEGRGRIDCAEVAERCIVAIAAASNYDRSGGAYLLFVGSPPFPGPAAVLLPSSGLAPGQRVVLTSSGLIPGRTYTVKQCLSDRCVLRATIVAGLDGSARTEVAVYATIRDAKGETPCAARCEIRVGGYGVPGGSSAPFPPGLAISFDPDAAQVATPLPTTTTTTTTPDATTTTGVSTTLDGPGLVSSIVAGSVPTTFAPGAPTTADTSTTAP